MTYLFQSSSVGRFTQQQPYAITPITPVITVNSSETYEVGTAARILAAQRGPRAKAPADQDKFLAWLTG